MNVLSPHSVHQHTSGAKAWRVILVFLSIGLAACTMPDSPGDFYLSRFLRLPLEVPLVALGLLLLPQRLAIALAAGATISAFALLFLKLADVGVISVFQRRFNPYLDIKMIGDGWNLLSGTIGVPGAALAVAGVGAALAGVMASFWWASMSMTLFAQGARRLAIRGFLLALVAGSVLWTLQAQVGMRPLADARVASYLGDRLALVVHSVADIRAFEGELLAEAGAEDQTELFAGIRDRDVILIFIESYGRSAIEDPRYGGLIQPRLDGIELRLRQAGFASASGWTRSPTVGGLSWLAHGTLLSGLWVDSQARYDMLMASGQVSLNRMFLQAGWLTAAVMPAITMDWPEAAYYGYEKIFAFKDLGYSGKPFNWVTMPDQYTLSAFDRLVRRPAQAEGRAVMAEIALISSHAPWTPVATLIDWEDVGDGTVFNAQAESGDPPAVVWADHARVRRQYVRTVDYALETVGDYILRFGGDAVFIFLGDHQPAALVTGEGASRSVPIHVVSRDRALVERFIAEGFDAGMTPAAEGPEPSMAEMRSVLIRAFGQR
ncbi:sulfatase [Pannonibacter carbonis]|uniref:sulfatase n=1 Tax=Pannonibacter carbonis TaxID=2067569 RepID=UPI0018E57E26|nr:sulfatase [Pannonibacter carbonis]